MQVVGFTGTSKGTTSAQHARVYGLLESELVTEGHQGDCVGADAEFAAMCNTLGIYLVGHPPNDDKARAWTTCDEWRDPYPYLVRDHHIVEEGKDLLIAAPGQYREILRSGTWATIRYARKLGRPRYIVWPDGRLEIER